MKLEILPALSICFVPVFCGFCYMKCSYEYEMHMSASVIYCSHGHVKKKMHRNADTLKI